MNLTPKLPTEAVAYVIPWAHQLGNDEIESYTLSVSSGTVTLSEEYQGRQHISVVISGGADGETATLAHQIVTLAGQRLDRTITLLVQDGVTAITPSTATKRTVINMAFEEIGLAGYEFDATPEEFASALRRLDVLMAQWRTSSLDLGYNTPAIIGQGDLDDESGLPDDSLNAVSISLALRVMPAIGKAMSAETRLALSQSMTALRAAYAVIPTSRLARGTPRGAGNKWAAAWSPIVGGCR